MTSGIQNNSRDYSEGTVHQVFVQRNGATHFGLVGEYKLIETAEEVERYYQVQTWVIATKIEPKLY